MKGSLAHGSLPPLEGWVFLGRLSAFRRTIQLDNPWVLETMPEDVFRQVEPAYAAVQKNRVSCDDSLMARKHLVHIWYEQDFNRVVQGLRYLQDPFSKSSRIGDRRIEKERDLRSRQSRERTEYEPEGDVRLSNQGIGATKTGKVPERAIITCEDGLPESAVSRVMRR